MVMHHILPLGEVSYRFNKLVISFGGFFHIMNLFPLISKTIVSKVLHLIQFTFYTVKHNGKMYL